MVSPWPTSLRWTRTPLTSVPFLLPRSTTTNRGSLEPPSGSGGTGSIRAWLRDKLLWRMVMVWSSARPMVAGASPTEKTFSSG